jgi:small subunit ribosomal protein S2
MERKPDGLILFGSHDEKIALHEANLEKIAVIALTDTNTNPNDVDFPIPANDDATKSVNLFANLFAQTIKEAKEKSKVQAVNGK